MVLPVGSTLWICTVWGWAGARGWQWRGRRAQCTDTEPADSHASPMQTIVDELETTHHDDSCSQGESIARTHAVPGKSVAVAASPFDDLPP